MQDEGTGWTPDMIPDENLPSEDDDDDEQVYAPISLNAPLYWSVYEYAWLAEQAGSNTNMPEVTWDANIDWGIGESSALWLRYDLYGTALCQMTNDPSIEPGGYMTHYAGIKHDGFSS